MASSTSIKNVSTSELKPYKMNSRVHSDQQINQLCKSIEKFGFTQPILIDEKNTILAGHGRLMAAQKLGIESVPVVVISGLSDAEKKAYIIADNKIGDNSTWNKEVLRLEIEDIANFDFEIDTLAFSDKEMTKLFDDFADVQIADFADDVPENPKVTIECRKDDLYEIMDEVNKILEKYRDAKVVYFDEQV